MNSTGLWLARLLPAVGAAVHLAGAVAIMGGSAKAGVGAIIAAWILILIYTLGFYAGGDFIQRTIGLKPWRHGDELQTDMRRSALAFSYWVVLIGLSFLIGLFLPAVLYGASAEAAAIDLRNLLLLLTSVAYAGAAAPTAFIAWRLRPIRGEG